MVDSGNCGANGESCFSASDGQLVELAESFAGKVISGGQLPNDSFACNPIRDDLLLWLPSRLPVGVSLTVASSRLGQKLEDHSDWFDALRTLAIQMTRQNCCFISSPNTTADRFVRRIAKLFSIPILIVEPFPKRLTKKWFAEMAVPEKLDDPLVYRAFFKPKESHKTRASTIDVNDLLVSLATNVVLLSVRRGGNVQRAAMDRLRCGDKTGAGNPSQVRLLINPKLTSRAVETDLLSRGATAWWLYRDSGDSAISIDGHRATGDQSAAPILTLDDVQSDRYLVHWTRRRVGHWPDQTATAYLDDLIFQSTSRDHGELAALCRILAMQRLLASNQLTRDARKVVCFSDVSLENIIKNRVFRPHLSRWDFEPYGIAIDRQLLQDLGAVAVTYGCDDDWKRLSDAEKPFFQKVNSQNEALDWRVEQEWRVVNDVNLQSVSPSSAVVFVRTQQDATIVAPISRWPVVVLER